MADELVRYEGKVERRRASEPLAWRRLITELRELMFSGLYI